MNKDTFYFTHDYNARQDPKIRRLIAKHQMAGYGIWWSIVEDLYNNKNVLPTDYDCIAFDLRADVDVVKSILHDFDLFVFDGNNFGSMSVQRRLDERNAKSAKARESVGKRWSNYKNITNVLQSKNDSNTIKEKKVKEKKVKESKGNLLKPHLFSESEIFELEKFKNAFKGTQYEQFDLELYHEKVKNWAAAKHPAPKKIDWIATSRNFMLGDKRPYMATKSESNQKVTINQELDGQQSGLLKP